MREKCSICLCYTGKRKYKTPCGHGFHYRCILPWVLINDTCPICRNMLRNSIKIEEEGESPLTQNEIFFLLDEIISNPGRRYSF